MCEIAIIQNIFKTKNTKDNLTIRIYEKIKQYFIISRTPRNKLQKRKIYLRVIK